MESAIVTGASRGIGFECARALSSLGFHIVGLASSYRAELEEKFKSAFGNNFTLVCGDINDASVRTGLIAAAVKYDFRFLLNCAGVAPSERRDLLSVNEESYDRVVDTNLKSTFFLTQSAANAMLEQAEHAQKAERGGRIVTVSSVSAYAASVNRAEYCISKAGLSMLTSLFSARLAEYNIPVFEIRPGIIETDMTSCVHSKYEERINGGLLPLKRFGQPEDVAKIIRAIAKGDFDYCTGQVFDCDGGFSVRTL